MKISLITVTYNSEKTLRKTIQSVLAQKFINLEYIIIDGQSKDNTVSIIKESEPLFNNNLKWISEKDTGIYDAMNKGIKIATGDIIGILNSDDYFTSDNILEIIHTTFEKNQSIDAIYGDIHYINNNPNQIIRYYSSKIFKPQLMRLGFMPAHPSFYVKKQVYTQWGVYKTNYKIAADFEFLLRVILKGKIQTLYLPIDMVTMKIGGVSTNNIKSHIQIMKEHLRACKENQIKTNIFLLSLRYFYKIYELYKYKIVFSLIKTRSNNINY